MMTDLHWAGGMLNPTLRGWAPLHEHDQSRRILNRVFRKLALDDETYVRVLNKYQDFFENRGSFQEAVDPILQKAPPHKWWDAMDSEAKALQTIARRILAQVCSISSCEWNWSIYSFVHNKVRNHLQPSRAKDLVYIYTNSRLLRHRRGPKPVQWYGIYQIHSDDESDGEAPDGDDPGGHPDIDANMADNDDIGGDAYGFDTIDSSDTTSNGDDSDSGGGGGFREYNGADSQFDGGGGGGDADLGVFDFCEGENQPHPTAPVLPVDDEAKDAPSIETFSVVEDLRQARHADSVVATNPTTDAVEHSHSASDSLDFGDAGEGGNIHQDCNLGIVEPPDQIYARSRAASPSVPPNTLMAPLPSRLQHIPRLCTIPSPNRPLTRNVANQRGIGHTLLMARAVLRNSNHAVKRKSNLKPKFPFHFN